MLELIVVLQKQARKRSVIFQINLFSNLIANDIIFLGKKFFRLFLSFSLSYAKCNFGST